MSAHRAAPAACRDDTEVLRGAEAGCHARPAPYITRAMLRQGELFSGTQLMWQTQIKEGSGFCLSEDTR